MIFAVTSVTFHQIEEALTCDRRIDLIGTVISLSHFQVVTPDGTRLMVYGWLDGFEHEVTALLGYIEAENIKFYLILLNPLKSKLRKVAKINKLIFLFFLKFLIFLILLNCP